MLEKINIFLDKIKKFLLILIISNSIFVGYIRFNLYRITRSIFLLNNNIAKKEKEKKDLELKLSYLKSPKRIISLMKMNPKFLQGKEKVKISQIKTLEELKEYSYAKVINEPYKNSRIAKNEKININEI